MSFKMRERERERRLSVDIHWGRGADFLKKCKNHIITGNLSHHGSSGNINPLEQNKLWVNR